MHHVNSSFICMLNTINMKNMFTFLLEKGYPLKFAASKFQSSMSKLLFIFFGAQGAAKKTFKKKRPAFPSLSSLHYKHRPSHENPPH